MSFVSWIDDTPMQIPKEYLEELFKGLGEKTLTRDPYYLGPEVWGYLDKADAPLIVEGK